MNALLDVSVIIPTFNNAPWLAQTIDSALGQSHPPLEVIVVDDCSTDDTATRLAAYGDRIVPLRQPTNRGPGAARNAGIARARGALVGFLDGDDAWHPTLVEKQVAEFAAHPDLGLSYAALTDCDENLKPNRPPRLYRRRRAERVFDELYLTAFVLPTSTVFARRAAFALCGGFAEDLNKAEDYECWLRIALRYPVSCLGESLALRRHHGQALTSSVRVESNIRQEREVFERCGRAAAAAGVTLPLSVAERQVLSLRRRLAEYLEYGDLPAARVCADELEKLGRMKPVERLRLVAGGARIALSRGVRRLLGRA